MKNYEIVDWSELFFYINTAKRNKNFKLRVEFVNEWKKYGKIRIKEKTTLENWAATVRIVR